MQSFLKAVIGILHQLTADLLSKYQYQYLLVKQARTDKTVPIQRLLNGAFIYQNLKAAPDRSFVA